MMAPMILRCRLFWLIIFVLAQPVINLSVASPQQPSEAVASQSTIKAVASIRPLHSLLSQLMQGVAEPALLLDQNQSPHHFSLRPSQRSTLSHADIFFWVGEPLESFMPRVLRAIPEKVKTISIIDNKKLQLLEPRSAQVPADDHSHSHHSHGHHDETVDPHIWLSVDNALVIARQMHTELLKADAENSVRYTSNLQALNKKLLQLKKQISTSLKNKTFNYLVYHDAFQYFENTLNIKPLAAISNDEEQAPGVRHLSLINKIIKNNAINCIIFNTATLPAVARNLVKPKNIRPIFIQPLGQNLDTGPELYFQLMKSLAHGYQQCSQASL